MKTATEIIDALGGPTKVANATGFPVTTVHSWGRYNRIPSWRHAALIKLAKSTGVALVADDFPSANRVTA